MRSRRYAELKRLEARRYALRRNLMSLSGNNSDTSDPGSGDRQVAQPEDVIVRQKETRRDQPAP